MKRITINIINHNDEQILYLSTVDGIDYIDPAAFIEIKGSNTQVTITENGIEGVRYAD